ncbi:hypothetical protein IAT40_005589 [Kwoniella sp. CBS 6097]
MPKWATDNASTSAQEAKKDQEEERSSSKRKETKKAITTQSASTRKASTKGKNKSTSAPTPRTAGGKASSVGSSKKKQNERVDIPSKRVSSSTKQQRALSSLTRPVPPPSLPVSTTVSKSNTTTTRKRTSTSERGLKGQPLPFTASTKPIGTRKFKQKTPEKVDGSDDEEDGEWDEHGIHWQPKVRPLKSEGAQLHLTKTIAKTDEIATKEWTEDTPVARRKQIPSSTPPLTGLRTPATLTQILFGHQTGGIQGQPVERRDLSNHQPSPLEHKQRAAQQEPLFLSKSPTITASPQPSPSAPPAAQPRHESPGYEYDYEEFQESPIARPPEPCGLDDSTTEDEDDEPMPIILPPPAFLSFKRSHSSQYRSTSFSIQDSSSIAFPPSRQPTYRSGGLSYQGATPDGYVIVPNSDTQVTHAPDHQAQPSLLADSFPPIDNRPASRSKSSRRQNKTYGKGRSHAFQHGVPLPRRTDPSQRLTSPLLPRAQSPPPSPDSYRGAKRRGSTSVWPDDGITYGNHVPGSFVVPDHDSPAARRARKKHKFVRNGPPPEARRKGVIIEWAESPGSPRWRRRRSDSPQIPLTKAFELAQSQGEVKYKRKSHLDKKRMKRQRRRELERRKDQRERRTNPVLELQKGDGVADRVDHWIQNVAQTLKYPRRTGTKVHRKLKRIPGWALKPIDTVRFEDYAEKWKQNLQTSGQPSKSRSSASRSSKGFIGGRVEELISAGRKAKYEHAIRNPHKRSKVKPNPAYVGTLKMTRLSPSPDISDLDDEIDDDSTRPLLQSHGNTRAAKAAKRVLKLSFSKSGHGRKEKRHPSEAATPQTSGRDGPGGADDTNVLGHDFANRSFPRRERRQGMPQAFRPPSQATTARGTPDLSERHSPVELSESPPNLPEPTQKELALRQPEQNSFAHRRPAPHMAHNVAKNGANDGQSTGTNATSATGQEAHPDISGQGDERPSEVLRSLASLINPQAQSTAGQRQTSLGVSSCQSLRQPGSAATNMGAQVQGVSANQAYEDIGHFPSREPPHMPATGRASVDAPDALNVSPTMVQPSATHSSGEQHRSTSSSNTHMTGFQFTEHLIAKPLPVEVARDIGHTFVEEQSKPSKTKTRAERDSARAKRVLEKRKREQRQTQLNFEPVDRSKKNHSSVPTIVPPDAIGPDLIEITRRREPFVAIMQSKSAPTRPSLATATTRAGVETTRTYGSKRNSTGQKLDICLPRHGAGTSSRSTHPKDIEDVPGWSNVMGISEAVTAPFKPPSQNPNPSTPYRTLPPQAQAQPTLTQDIPMSLVPTELSTQMPPAAQRGPLSTRLQDFWAETTATVTGVDEMTKMGRVKDWRSKSSRAGRGLGLGGSTAHQTFENDVADGRIEGSKRYKSSRVPAMVGETSKRASSAAKKSGHDDGTTSRSRWNNGDSSSRGAMMDRETTAKKYKTGTGGESLKQSWGGDASNRGLGHGQGNRSKSKSKRDNGRSERGKRYLSAADYFGSDEEGF